MSKQYITKSTLGNEGEEKEIKSNYLVAKAKSMDILRKTEKRGRRRRRRQSGGDKKDKDMDERLLGKVKGEVVWKVEEQQWGKQQLVHKHPLFQQALSCSMLLLSF